ncbi:MAG: lasso peptide biosynthesis PqqD family chaperone [Butyrivibrio sp.]|nr:lasso peptide biosynthesis PqqD family chaperone [Butyrivibrio sp.]
MELSDVVKLKKDLNVTDLSGEKVMIDFESGKYFMLKGAGNAIWDIIQEEITVEGIIDKLTSEYDISREDCEKSVKAFLEKLKELDFI